MRKFLCVLMLTSYAIPALSAFSSQEEVSKWLTFYYQAPEPSRLTEAIEYMSQSGMLDNANATAPIFGFISGVFEDNPERVTEWINKLGSLKGEHLGVVVLGLWYANLPESKTLVYSILDKHETLNTEYSFLRKGSPMPVDKIPLEQGAWVLDSLWGKFMATGNKEPVERIMEALPWVDIKGDVNRLLIGGAARWSLTSNAVQHDRVFEFCETAEQTKPKEVAIKLHEVLDNAREGKRENQDGHNQSLQPASSPIRLLG